MGVLDHINLDGTEYDIQDAGAYRKPNGGIPKSDLADGVKESLSRADNAAPQSTTYTKGETDTKLSQKANSSSVYTKSETDERLATKANASDVNSAIGNINAKIPSEASSSNQLADKLFVNSSISTSTATFRGTYNLVDDLSLAVNASHEQIAARLGTIVSGADKNDYAFVQIPTSATTPAVISSVERYKYNGSSWAFEYALNNSGFTSAQWAAINSGITSNLVTKLSALPSIAQLITLLNGKQDVIDDLSSIRSGAQAGATAVQPADIADTPDFIEEEISQDLTDEIDRILAVLYQALTDAGVQITAAQEAAALANAKATLANDAATAANTAAANANDKATLANNAATLATQKAGLADTAATNANDKATLANSKATLADNAATSANSAATNANNKAALANDAATLANTKAGLADDAATLANTKALYAQDQGDYAKAQGDYAKAKADEIEDAKGDYNTLDARLDAMEAAAGDVEFVEEAEETFTF